MVKSGIARALISGALYLGIKTGLATISPKYIDNVVPPVVAGYVASAYTRKRANGALDGQFMGSLWAGIGVYDGLEDITEQLTDSETWKEIGEVGSFCAGCVASWYSFKKED